MSALKLISNYLTNPKKLIKNSYISSKDIHFRAPQGSILGLVLFNIFLSDLLLLITDDIDFASYTNDSIIYCAGGSIDSGIMSLQDSAKKVFQSFFDNQMKGYTDNCHLLLKQNNETQLEVGDFLIETSSFEKLLGGKKLSFDKHIENICTFYKWFQCAHLN